MSAKVAAAKAAVAVASDKRGRAAIATILCSILMLFFLPLIVYMGVMSNLGEIEIDTAQAQQMIVQNMSSEEKTKLSHLESVMKGIGNEFKKRKLNNYTIKKAQALYACALYDVEKTNLDLVKWAQFAYDSKWGYVWGSHGQVLTEKELNRLKGVFGSHVTDKEAYIREHWLGRRTSDCVGLIKGYGWYNEESGTIKYGTNGMKDVTADGMYSAATEKGPISTMPDIPGLAVWHQGHIGVYIGNGYVIHAANTYDGVIKTPITSSGWTHWLKVPYINYLEEQEIENE